MFKYIDCDWVALRQKIKNLFVDDASFITLVTVQ
jgi:hypothetical protein